MSSQFPPFTVVRVPSLVTFIPTWASAEPRGLRGRGLGSCCAAAVVPRITARAVLSTDFIIETILLTEKYVRHRGPLGTSGIGPSSNLYIEHHLGPKNRLVGRVGCRIIRPSAPSLQNR